MQSTDDRASRLRPYPSESLCIRGLYTLAAGDTDLWPRVTPGSYYFSISVCLSESWCFHLHDGDFEAKFYRK